MVNAATGTDPHAAAHAASPDAVRRELLDQPARVRRRLRVVPQLGGTDHLTVGVEHDEAVLLAGDGDRGDVGRRHARAHDAPRAARPTTCRDPARCAAASSADAARARPRPARRCRRHAPPPWSTASTSRRRGPAAACSGPALSGCRAAARSRAGRGVRGRSRESPSRRDRADLAHLRDRVGRDGRQCGLRQPVDHRGLRARPGSRRRRGSAAPSRARIRYVRMQPRAKSHTPAASSVRYACASKCRMPGHCASSSSFTR